jgi:phytoene/squalene synthetase
LQLINFWQDVAVDQAKDRLYLPLEDLMRFGVDSESLGQDPSQRAWCTLMQFEVDRTRTMMFKGAPLARLLPGRIGLELRLVVQGGLRILEKIEQVRFDVFHQRPVLTGYDWPLLVWRALWMRA